eukprot:CAMPEP_0176424892 /NCGR_PEP_ID=MMETSP0127-20121128/11090_1 /TAXON_ID=938130 /ORGANISM="Platyophrya macrostoma, Strain WH" /LENGTH=430 /DNA_ID=CAMNT_0017806001 /DNA_START=31 /DNA_END=1323 /DNA_ORIENTATION=-
MVEKSILKSFIAYAADHPFPIQNIPFGVFIPNKDHLRRPRCGTRIGDFVIDLDALEAKGYFKGERFEALKKDGKSVFNHKTLNYFMSLGKPYWREARTTIQQLFAADGGVKDDMEFRNLGIHDYRDVTMTLPAETGDYTDYNSSKNHALNVGKIFRGATTVSKNWECLPVAYHGRASSIVVSGTDFHRPYGQVKKGEESEHVPTRQLDYELEVGFYFGGPENKLGYPIKISEAEDCIFGLVLFNDWSARDIQAWEGQPLGPFTAKNFASVVSPWVVTIDALEPFRIPLPKQDPAPLEYLASESLTTFDFKVNTYIKPEGKEKSIITASNFKYLYWSMAQQLTHHTVSGCNMRAGDLLAGGTISGPEKSEQACLLELTVGGKEPVQVGDETRIFLEDNDTVIMDGYADSKDGFRIGFGECVSKVLPAIKFK